MKLYSDFSWIESRLCFRLIQYLQLYILLYQTSWLGPYSTCHVKQPLNRCVVRAQSVCTGWRKSLESLNLKLWVFVPTPYRTAYFESTNSDWTLSQRFLMGCIKVGNISNRFSWFVTSDFSSFDKHWSVVLLSWASYLCIY